MVEPAASIVRAPLSVGPLMAEAGGQPRPGGVELLLTYLPMLLIVLVAWLLLYRPERERQRRQQELLAALKKNDRVVTTAGLYGIVANVDRDNDRVLLKIDDASNVKIAVTLSSVSRVLTAEGDGTAADA
jgi:preprotein translocase subunit YajC